MTIDKRIIDLYNEYVHSALPRRDFMTRLVKIAGGTAAALAVLPLIEPNYAQARQTEPDDKRLATEKLQFNGPDGPVKAYVARPRKLRRRDRIPGILVIHENRGLNEHIEDVTRRVALAGYMAVAPDGLSSAGGAPADQEAARDLFAKTDGARIASDILAAVPWLAGDASNNGKIGVVGFCYGGGLALRAAVENIGVDAAVAYYGKQLPAQDTKRLRVPILLHYAGNDERVNAGIPEFKAALDAQGATYTIEMYPGTDHGFNNDSSAARYNDEAARLAWSRTIAFFDANLKPQIPKEE
ncbi:MAG: dienelactone hydrolase family protein [Pseudomonadota bacterium]